MQLNLNCKRLAFALAVAMSISHASAQTQDCKKPKVFFVNGVFNEQWQAQDASRKLEAAITSNGGPASLHITTLYNPTDPGLGDALEIAQDYVLAGKHLSMAWWLAYLAEVVSAAAPPLQLVMLHITEGKTYTGWLAGQIDGTAASLRNEDVITKIRSTLLKEVRDNKTPVVVIAHSEGNFYLNEAIRRLKTADDTKDIPGVQAIGVLGIGVASRFNPATLSSGQRLYRYVTKADDAIIVPLKDVLPANFTNVIDDRITSSSPTHHELITDYLYSNVKGTFGGTQGASIRKVVVDEFTNVYNATSELFPCVHTVTASPNPITADRPVTFTGKVISRVGIPITSGAISFVDGGTAEFCAAALAADGSASCTITFGSNPIPPKLYAQWTTGIFKSNTANTEISIGSSHWEGTFIKENCPLGDNVSTYIWLWEKPCYTMGITRAVFGTLAQNSFSSLYAKFFFSDSESSVIFEGDQIRSRRILNWKSTSDTLYAEMPTSFSMALPISQVMVNYDGLRKIEMKVTSRTPSNISGTFSVKSMSVYGRFNPFFLEYIDKAAEDGLTALPTETTGRWTARLVSGPPPDLQLNGNDACQLITSSAGTANVGKVFQPLYRGPFLPAFKNYFYYSDNLFLVNGASECKYGLQ